MDEGLIKDRYELIIGEVQALISIGYLMMVTIGMMFNYFKYEAFGINIFDYGDVFDFLIAPFAEIKILLVSIFALLLAYAAFRLDIFWKEKHPKSYSKASFGLFKYSWYEPFRVVTFILAFFAILFGRAVDYGETQKKKIMIQDPITITFVDNTIKKGILIGKTSDILFLLETDQVKAIPIASQVKEIQIR